MMNWSYIRNTSPNYWRYQGPIFALSILIGTVSVWSIFENPELSAHPATLLSMPGAFAVTLYQTVLMFAAFHIIVRGIYKAKNKPSLSKFKRFKLAVISSLTATLAYAFFDFLPIILSLFPYTLADYIKSVVSTDNVLGGIAIFIFYNTIFYVIWTYFYILASSISNYKQIALLLKKQELQILTNRVNPEFLFDTMNAIKTQIDNDEERAADLVTKASDLFRYNLMSSKSPEAKLGNELVSIRNYLELLTEQKKAPQTHDIKLHDEEIAPLIPSMSLIFICSFLLNSARNRSGDLTIAGYVENNIYRLEISHKSHGKLFLDTEHFDNVKTRLQHLYDNNASLVMIKRGKRRKVIMALPVHQHKS